VEPAPDGAAATDDLAARFRSADALRRLGHAIVGHHVDAAVLDDIAATAHAWLAVLDQAPPRSRPVDDMKRRSYVDADRDDLDHFPDCVVSGQANPMGIAIRPHREGDEAVARVTLGAAFEGAPGRAHGGVVAAVFDDVMGMVLRVIATPAYTGEITVRYLAPTPVGTELEFRARLTSRAGRKLFMEAEAVDVAASQKVAGAKATFIEVDLH
jgi:acyl-coenzyme A thioesterase PaaI-like protein